jgi:hypothetical protein
MGGGWVESLPPLAGVVGFEPTTHRLTADCAAIAPHAKVFTTYALDWDFSFI